MSAVRLLPWVVHEIIEYVAGVFLILAPFVLFSDKLDTTAAFPLFVGVGVLVVALQLFTHGKAGIAELLPVRVHATLDYLVAIFLILSPFLFGLTADGEPEEALFIPMLLGVAHLVITLVTRFPLEQPAADASASPASGSPSSPASGSQAVSTSTGSSAGSEASSSSASDTAGGSDDDSDASAGSDRQEPPA